MHRRGRRRAARTEWDRVILRIATKGWDRARDRFPDAVPIFSRVIDELRARGASDRLIESALEVGAFWYSATERRLVLVQLDGTAAPWGNRL